ncbi:MAG: putative esterase of the alpha-beta hydrolase superfamily [Bacteroidetes bacterium]|nr:putative esterase of the alpha-beta hydrolase superfamily [Bacteroidota bacterium]
MKKKVQLVLGSGGARGIAHIGVIEMLEQEGYEIVEVYGCSMGAIIGGLYCAGILREYTEWLIKQTKSDVYRLFDITFSMAGFVKGERIFGILQQMSGQKKIEDLPIKFVAVATDIIARKEVHFSDGDLFKALRASSGIPGVFTPIAHEKGLYVDGGVLNPLPVDIFKRRKDAIVVAVNLNGSVPHDLVNDIAPVHNIVEAVEDEASDVLTKMRNFFTRAKDTENKVIKPVEPILPSLSMFELLSESYDASLDRLVEIMLQRYPVDILIEIPRNASSVFEFYRAAELIEVGKKAYTKSMDMHKTTKEESTLPAHEAPGKDK